MAGLRSDSISIEKLEQTCTKRRIFPGYHDMVCNHHMGRYTWNTQCALPLW